MSTPRADSTDADSDRGTHQNIARASQVLTALAGSSTEGMRLADVVRETQLSKTAAHRCLAGLVAHGLAEFNDETSRFHLGDRIFGWTQLAGPRFELAERALPHLRRLAADTSDTAYLMVRRRDEAVCYGRAEGNFPIKTLTLSVGDRRPLGIGSGSLALLAFLDDEEEVERIIAKHAEAYERLGTSVKSLRKLISAARRSGYVSVDGQVIDGMGAVGVPVRCDGAVVAALSVAAISARLPAARREEVAALLHAEAARFESGLQAVLQRF